MSETHTATPCHVCRTGWLRVFPAFSALARVSSDAKPFPSGGELAVCEQCGTVQKPITPAWQAEADAIYAAYTIYHNAGGAEQKVFAGGGGQPASRSSRLVQQLRDRVGLPATGRMLDLGCGNGAMLRSFSEQMPGWSLAGTELSDKYREAVEAIPRVEKLYAGQPEDVPGMFDAMTLLHVLEHVPDPVAFLARLARKMNPGGHIVVEVPDHRQNPFDLAIADHCTHFSLGTLRAVFEAAGLEVVAAAEDFIPKELTVVGRPGGCVQPLGVPAPDVGPAVDTVGGQIEWLAALAGQGRSLAAAGKVGVFGTSIGGAWLLGELGNAVGF
ncbi:MAG TPA: class I SAM-dependent methyltransferase, partial [Gemmataceae bacterium]|nr:class I SAM-dependent methyltransferase [Gemmataceae bacterium]